MSFRGGCVTLNAVLVYVKMLLSGLAITAELNSLLNEVYQIVIFCIITGLDANEFYKKTVMGFYGDDIIASIHRAIRDIYNTHTIIKTAKDCFGMEMTPASDKTGACPPFISIYEAKFLKRSFVLREGRVDAPLELETPRNSLQFYKPKLGMDQNFFLSSKIRTFILEMTHYSKEIYDEWAMKFMTFKHEFNLHVDIPVYEVALQARVNLIGPIY